MTFGMRSWAVLAGGLEVGLSHREKKEAAEKKEVEFTAALRELMKEHGVRVLDSMDGASSFDFPDDRYAWLPIDEDLNGDD